MKEKGHGTFCQLNLQSFKFFCSHDYFLKTHLFLTDPIQNLHVVKTVF